MENNYNWSNEICTCDCHKEGLVVMHAFPCCEFTYEKYIDVNGINQEKLDNLRRNSEKIGNDKKSR